MKINYMKRYEIYLQDYPFFVLPNLSTGIARVLDLGGTFNDNNITFDPDHDDFKAIKSDWEIIGKDIFVSLKKFKNSK